jgi:hypothetical protein
LAGAGLVVDFRNYAGAEYWLVVNSRPWALRHTMLVSKEPLPQCITPATLQAALELLEELGTAYEVMFNGVLAAASVYHFHVQIHGGQTAIWSNLAAGAIRRRELVATDGVALSHLAGWPAYAYLFEAPERPALLRAASRAIGLLSADQQDIPFNFTARQWGGKLSLILLPRSAASEKPEGLNRDPQSWSRFGCMEMAGTILLLSEAGYAETAKSPGAISQALRQMTIDDSTHHHLCEMLRCPPDSAP